MEKGMKTIPTKIPAPIVEEMDAFVRQGLYGSRSELIREATRRFIADEVEKLQPSRVYMALIEKEVAGKIKKKSLEEFIKETKDIRRAVWKKRKSKYS